MEGWQHASIVCDSYDNNDHNTDIAHRLLSAADVYEWGSVSSWVPRCSLVKWHAIGMLLQREALLPLVVNLLQLEWCRVRHKGCPFNNQRSDYHDHCSPINNIHDNNHNIDNHDDWAQLHSPSAVHEWCGLSGWLSRSSMVQWASLTKLLRRAEWCFSVVVRLL
jgi:hypothetical protein